MSAQRTAVFGDCGMMESCLFAFKKEKVFNVSLALDYCMGEKNIFSCIKISLFMEISGIGVFPKTEVQLCIVHQVRNFPKDVASKNQKEFMKDLKTVCQVPIGLPGDAA